MPNLSRRGFLGGLFAAPAIIALDRLMPVRAVPLLRAPTTLYVNAADALLPSSINNAARALFASIAEALDYSIPGDSIMVLAGHVETLDRPLVINTRFEMRDSFLRFPTLAENEPMLEFGPKATGSLINNVLLSGPYAT